MRTATDTTAVLGKGVALERYHDTALAIGLTELLGNAYPNSKQLRLAEALVKRLSLSWEDCLNANTLKRTLSQAG